MSLQDLIPSNAVTVANGKPTTTSLVVADVFGKRHSDVLRDIDGLDCSPEFRKRNFALTSRQVNGPNGSVRQERYFDITKDGFTFLVMGYTGAKAAQFKEAYIQRFNEMEAAVAQVNPADIQALRAEVQALRAKVERTQRIAGPSRKSQFESIRDKVAAYLARNHPCWISVEFLGREVLHKAQLTPDERRAVLAGLQQMGFAK